MTTSHHTIPIVQVRAILQGAQHQGLALTPLLQRAGISPGLLESPRSRVSQSQYAQLIRVLRREMRDELWGLCARPLPPGSFAQALRVMVGCETLGGALRAGFQFYRLVLDDFAARLQCVGNDAHVRLFSRLPADDRQHYAQRTFLFFTFGIASWLVERRLPVNVVQVSEPEPLERSETARIFQAPVCYDQPYTAFSFDSVWLHHPVRQDQASLREFLAQAPTNLLIKYRDQSRLTERIRRYLRKHLSERVPSLEEVAEELRMTPQTLRRRLRDEGEGYQTIKDEVRRDAAVDFLARQDLSLMDIANRTGFSEPSTFHRAFKKWTGLAPGEYRQTVLEAPDAAEPTHQPKVPVGSDVTR
ncbi:MAG: AraC family transcriptional regulator [Ectothiorhodospiraceae bacterium]|nr:AraC family transcriptional regulator [Ectothiorhodospiraceae bacterium]MCH8505671.1 AraC family transcriptional regulator [Ectothiorhodospiraceae bacterium]